MTPEQRIKQLRDRVESIQQIDQGDSEVINLAGEEFNGWTIPKDDYPFTQNAIVIIHEFIDE